MIDAQINTPFPAVLEGAATGLVGQLGVKILALPAGTVAAGRVTTGITEIAAGVYAVELVAPATDGDYIVVWDAPDDDADSDPEVYTEALRAWGTRPPDAPPDVLTLPPAPTLEQIAALMPSRLGDEDDNPQATFSDDPPTNPTAAQVTAVIPSVQQEVAAECNCWIPAQFADMAQSIVAMGCVAYIEPGARPEGDFDSLGPTARQIFLGRLAKLANLCDSPRPIRLV